MLKRDILVLNDASTRLFCFNDTPTR